MNTRSEQKQNQTNKAAAANIAQKQDGAGSGFSLADERPQAETQINRDAIIQNSPKMQQLQFFQKIADNNTSTLQKSKIVAQLVREKALPAGQAVIQRSPGKVGRHTYFYKAFDSPGIEIEVGEEFEICQPWEFSDDYVAVNYKGEKGWILYKNVKSVNLETLLANSIASWNILKNTNITGPPALNSVSINSFEQIKTEMDQFRAMMEKEWPGSYLFDFTRQLDGYERVLDRDFNKKVEPTIKHYLRLLPVQPGAVDLAVVKRLDSLLRANDLPLSREAQKMWVKVRQIYLEGGDIQNVYLLSGNPAETNKFKHEKAKISPQTAYLSDNRETEPAPESRLGPKGKRIQTGDSRDKLTLAKGDEQVYVRHVRDTRPGHTSIFIDNTPTGDDVAQTGIGDCYYLAVVASIADRDPAKIKALFSQTNTDGPVTVTFFFKDMEGGFYQQPVTIDQNLVYNVQTGDLLGNRMKIKPVGTSRWVLKKTKKQTQHIIEERYYQSALWAPLLEKAFARFAEIHGKYGAAFSAPSGDKGYEIISGGRGVHRVYEVFYGNKIQAETVPLRSQKSAQQMLDPNDADYVRAIQKLLLHEDANKSLSGNNQVQMLTASAGIVTTMQRVVEYIDRLKQADYDQFEGDLKTYVESQAVILADKFKQALDMITKEGIEEGDRRLIAVQSTAENYTRYLLDFIFEGLGAKKGSRDVTKKPSTKVRHLMQLLLDILGGQATLSTENKQRYIYTQHEYAVVDVHLIDHQKSTIKIDASDLENVKAAMPKINLIESTVTLRNPHHANRPDFYGKRQYKDAGLFTLKLSKFLRNFDMITSGLAQKG